MDTISYALGFATGSILATVIFAYAFYKYKADTREKNLKDYTELQVLISNLEKDSQVVPDNTEEILNEYVEIETLVNKEDTIDGNTTEKCKE